MSGFHTDFSVFNPFRRRPGGFNQVGLFQSVVGVAYGVNFTQDVQESTVDHEGSGIDENETGTIDPVETGQYTIYTTQDITETTADHEGSSIDENETGTISPVATGSYDIQTTPAANLNEFETGP